MATSIGEWNPSAFPRSSRATGPEKRACRRGSARAELKLFYWKKPHTRKARNEMALNPLKTNDHAKSYDSPLIMISMTYDQQCERLRFASRNESLSFSLFRPRRRPKRNGAVVRFASGGLRPRRDFVDRDCPANLEGDFFEAALRRLKTRSSDKSQDAEKLRKSALKSLKQLVRVNLCASQESLVQLQRIGSEPYDSR